MEKPRISWQIVSGNSPGNNTLILFLLIILSLLLIYLHDNIPKFNIPEKSFLQFGTSTSQNQLTEQNSFPNFPNTAEFRSPYQLWPDFIQPNPDYINNSEKLSKYKSKKIVLLYHDSPDKNATLDSSIFEKCPVNQCAITSYRAFFARSAAVIFLAENSWGSTTKDRKAKRAFPEQMFVYYNGESPVHAAERGWILDRNFFNWTMTYRLDSDIRSHYTYVVNLEKQKRNFAKGKKLLSWFVSHCHTISRREVYVEELRKYIPVATYGKCGNYGNSSCPKDAPCKKEIMRTHKFYLAFENSICGDYVTEKMTNALEAETVPIVMGKGNYKIFPPNSYIHVKDFKSPALLAEYLLELDKNDTKYNEYMQWRYNPKFIKSYGQYAAKHNGFCQLCKKLHALRFNPEISRSYTLIKQWRGNLKGSCLPGFWIRPDGSNTYNNTST